jgi:L-amino acid ligase
MNSVVREANLRAPSQFECDRLDDLLLRLRDVAYPLVIKPVASGGTDHVYLCNSANQAADFFHQIYNSKNLFGVVNTSVLVQEYIDGVEYAIDCVSFDGRHICIDCFQYQKGVHNNRDFIYEKERFLRSENPIQKRLQSFARRALKALDFRTGASHMEVKINSDDEIVFIEVGARLNGDDTHKLVRDTRADGKSQVEYTIDAVLGSPPPEPDYETAKEGIRVHIISEKSGVLEQISHLDKITSLRSYARMNLHVVEGQTVLSTTDFASNAGWVDLVNEDQEALRADEEILDTILAEGIFIFA